MTAPGQEPDEVLSATPGGKGPEADKPNLDAIGDSHMPEDLREEEAAKAEQEKAEGREKSDDRHDEPGDSED